MLRTKSMFAGIALILILFVDIVHAEIIRSGDGRPTLSRQFATTLIYLEDRYLNDQGVVSGEVGNSISNIELWGSVPNPNFPDIYSLNNVGNGGIGLNDNIGARAAKFGEGFGVGVFPSGTFDDGTKCYRDGGNVSTYESNLEAFEEASAFVDSYTNSDGSVGPFDNDSDKRQYDNAVRQVNFLRGEIDNATKIEACKWQYTQGQELSIFGFYQWLLKNDDGSVNTDIDYDVSYIIDNNIYEGILNTETSSVGITLAGNALEHLAAGEYDIKVQVTLSTSKGKFFTTVDDPDEFNNIQFQFDPTCVDNPQFSAYNQFMSEGDYSDEREQQWIAQNGAVPNEFICGRKVARDGGAGSTFSPRSSESFWSATERLIVVASNQAPEIKVNAPGLLSLLLLGVGLVSFRRFKR